MAVIALVSAKGSPGVTTAALALTLIWPNRCVLAECDPAGGSVQAGYLAGSLAADRGIRELAVSELRGESLRDRWWGQLVDLQHPTLKRLLLPGISDPVQSGALRPVWDRFATFFAELEHLTPGYDVIVDCGRLAAPNTPWPVINRADAVLLALRPSLPGMAAAVPTLRTLRSQLVEHGAGTTPLGLLVTGPGDQSVRTVGHELHNPVVACLPDDPKTARVLSHGGNIRMNSPLMRAAARAHPTLVSHVQHRRAAGAQPDPGQPPSAPASQNTGV
ncbi:ParA family protein [Natronosporangium hydrolyticum]|uniref:ParA family protein n=1 Tax=Natronosporangium hydrolyticum TaxID=2811111 RepID=A0A895YK80_9ACTN|nr:ParA family protein [Natronosporangium hydrolyticum]QSB15733.1 ParA family protein [Natronosporangium hydrolyticum]